MSEARTEEPTPRREREARERGRAWQSRDLVLGAVLVTSGALVRGGAGGAREALTGLFTRALDAAATPGPLAPRAAVEEAALAGTWMTLPWLLAIVGVAAVTSAVQVGGLFAPGAVAPDPSRLDPSARFGGPSGRSVGTSLLSVVRLGLLLAVGLATFLEAMPGIATLARQPPSAALDACFVLASALTLRTGLALLALGVVDAIVERALFRASLRTTRRERERERRDAEGDEHLRRERERVRDELHRGDDLAEAGAAALVVTDGALAIMLAYDASDPDAVPRVSAIARDARAEEVTRVAREHGRPCVEDAELAARLAVVALGAVIPEALYEPVARAMQARA